MKELLSDLSAYESLPEDSVPHSNVVYADEYSDSKKMIEERTKKLCWEFALLPEEEGVLTEEALEWFECTETDLENLKREGWVKDVRKAENGEAGRIYYVMPISKRNMVWLTPGNAPEYLAEPLVSQLIQGSFISAEDHFPDRVRKVKIEIAVFTNMKKLSRLKRGKYGLEKEEYAEICFAIGNDSVNLHHRADAEQYYREALQLFEELERENPGIYKERVADTCNNLGSLISEDSSRRREAENLYREAMKIRREREASDPDLYFPDLARTCYLFGLFEAGPMKNYRNAERLFEEAYWLWRRDPYYEECAETARGRIEQIRRI